MKDQLAPQILKGLPGSENIFSDEPVYIKEGRIYAFGKEPPDSGSYTKVREEDEVYINNLPGWSLISGNFYQDVLTAEPNDEGVTATHTWEITNPDFGTPGEDGDEVDIIEVEYETASFDGLTEADVTVDLTRTLSDGLDKSDISVNSGDYSGNTARFELSGYSQTDAAGPITVTINGIQNPSGKEVGIIRLEGDAEPYQEQGVFPENPLTLATAAPDVNIYHVDIGQGDCSIIRTSSNETVVIDTGTAGEFINLRVALEKLGVKNIDAFCTTHAHTDHIGGAAELVNVWETEKKGIDEVYITGVTTGTQTYQDYIDAIESNNVTLKKPVEGDELPVNGGTFKILNPKNGSLNSVLHDNSMTIKVESAEFSWLQTGDANETAESRMINSVPEELDVDVYQAGHHASDTSSTPEFLDKVQPDEVVISVGEDNSFGHPIDSVLDRYASRGYTTYWTVGHGNVTTKLDKVVQFETENESSTDPIDIKNAKTW